MSVPCRFGCSDAAARVELSDGCFCYPEDRTQDLCMQHLVRASPLGSMRVVAILDESWRKVIEQEFSA